MSRKLLTCLLVLVSPAWWVAADKGPFVTHIRLAQSHLVELDETHFLLVNGAPTATSWRAALRHNNLVHIWHASGEPEETTLAKLEPADRQALSELRRQVRQLAEESRLSSKHSFLWARYSLSSHATDLQSAHQSRFEVLGELGVRLEGSDWSRFVSDWRLLRLAQFAVQVGPGVLEAVPVGSLGAPELDLVSQLGAQIEAAGVAADEARGLSRDFRSAGAKLGGVAEQARVASGPPLWAGRS